MHKSIHAFVLMLGVLLVLLNAVIAAQKPTCAVLTFDAGEGITVGDAKFIIARFAALLTQLDEYDVVARSQMEKILKMAEFNRMDQCSATHTK